MERTGDLVRIKYREYFLSTLAMTGSTVIANLVDRFMVGNILGSIDMAATVLCSPVIFIINVVYGLFIYGGNTLSAMYRGQRDKRSADGTFTIAIIGGMLVCALITALGLLFSEPVAHALCAHEDELIGPVEAYFVPLVSMGILVIWVNGTAAFIRSDGLRTLAVAIPIVSNSVNLLMDFVFMKLMGFGVASAGWATNIGMAVAGLLVLPYLRSKKRTVFFRFSALWEWRLIWEVFRMGMATALVNASLALKNWLMNTVIVTAMGSVGSVIMSVCLTANSVGSVFYLGTTQTMLPIGGGLYGERDYRGIRFLFRTAFIRTTSICCAIMVLFMIFPEPFAAFFGVDISGIRDAFLLDFRLYCFIFPITGFQSVMRSHMQSCGHKNAATVMMVLDGTVCFIPFLYLFAAVDPTLIWLVMTISPLLSVLILYVYVLLRARAVGIRDPLFIPKEAKDADTLELTIENELSDVGEASMCVLGFCRKNGIPDEIGNKVWLSIQELCSNIARYAYRDGRGEADIFLKITTDEVILRIRDNGIMFDPTEFIDDSGQVILGLKLLRALELRLEYNRVLGFNNTLVSFER